MPMEKYCCMEGVMVSVLGWFVEVYENLTTSREEIAKELLCEALEEEADKGFRLADFRQSIVKHGILLSPRR